MGPFGCFVRLLQSVHAAMRMKEILSPRLSSNILKNKSSLIASTVSSSFRDIFLEKGNDVRARVTSATLSVAT